MAIVDDGMMASLNEFWSAVLSEDFSKDLIEVDFDCKDKECLYSFVCSNDATIACVSDGVVSGINVRCKCYSSKRKIGKWCPYYCEKFMEKLQKEDEGNGKEKQ